MIKRLAATVLAGYMPLAIANDFPTQARVEYVLSCMRDAGEQSYDTLYSCVCEVDRIAAVMPYQDYTKAETLSFLYSTPGERGGIFRDAVSDARKRVKALAQIRETARAACSVRTLVAPETN